MEESEVGYDSLHRFSLGSPCLSFDILRDDLGLVRSAFPHTVFCVAGTQATEASSNFIGIFKLSNILGKTSDFIPANAEASDTDSDSSEVPSLQLCLPIPIPHPYPLFLQSLKHNVWDLSSHLNALAESTDTVCNDAIAASNQDPLVKFKHQDEGYALDWSSIEPGRLVSGDSKNFIHLWEPTGATWNIDSNPFVGHTASVEDLQWCPTIPSVFASCSVDGSVAIWDIRTGRSPEATIKAHEADVNVISWSRLAQGFLASGSDDGSFSIWDLRLLKDGNSMLEHFEYHEYPITSIEWSPHEVSALAVSSSDNELTIWDLFCGRDEEEEAEFGAKTKEQVDAPPDFPPQLVFIHQGQDDMKELHWHPQIPGMVISTAHDGFNVIIPTTMANSPIAADA
ncbi:hypothetical protein Leryth_007307 [Lithospermum erythrorhizon]|nr:hypothetical protein Leryth_007307 [Lithospermum erythrorhizon]